MKDSCFRSSTKTLLAVTLLLVLFAATVPSPAAASTYTYTGKPFTQHVVNNTVVQPDGSYLTISFTYNGDLSTVLWQNLTLNNNLSAFSMTWVNPNGSNVSLNLNSPGLVEKHLEIRDISNGVPSMWGMTLKTDQYWLSSGTGIDDIAVFAGGAPVEVANNQNKPGTWKYYTSFRIWPGLIKWIQQLLGGS